MLLNKFSSNQVDHLAGFKGRTTLQSIMNAQLSQERFWHCRVYEFQVGFPAFVDFGKFSSSIGELRSLKELHMNEPFSTWIVYWWGRFLSPGIFHTVSWSKYPRGSCGTPPRTCCSLKLQRKNVVGLNLEKFIAHNGILGVNFNQSIWVF